MSKPLILDYYEFDCNKQEKYLSSRRETFKLKFKFFSFNKKYFSVIIIAVFNYHYIHYTITITINKFSFFR